MEGFIMAKMGRPKLDNPRTERVYLRLTPEQKEELYSYAAEHGRSVTDTLMYAFWEKIGKLDKYEKPEKS